MTEELPPGWARTPLGSLGEWFGGGTPSKAVGEYWRDGTVPWVSPKDMKRPLIESAQDRITERAVRESATNLVPANSVLMVTRSGILEHSFPVAVNTVPVAMNQDLKAVAVRGVDAVYASYFLRSRAEDILRTCKKDGTTVSSIDSDRLAAYEISIAPATEQKRIVSKIDELFSCIDEGERALERVQKLVERYRQSVLKAAVTGELTREWREKNKDKLESGEALLARILKARREAWEKAELEKMKAKGITPANDKWKQKYEEPLSPDMTDLPELPDGWVWASLDMLADIVGGITVDQKRRTEDCEPVPYLRVANVQRGYLDLSEMKSINAPRDRIEQLRLRPGDILFNEGGDIDKLGRGWIWEGQLSNCIHQNHVFRARLVILYSLNKIISWYGNVMGRTLFMRLGKQTTNLASLSLSKLKSVPVPIMCPSEADEIVSRVDDIFSITDHHGGEIEKQMRGSSSVRHGVLKAAFSGRLVSQDPADEPASMLLKRIAAGRGTNHGAPMRGRKKKPSA